MNDLADRAVGGNFADRYAADRYLALERLWRALSDRGNTRIGYNPAVADACEELRRLDGRTRDEDEA